MAKICINSELAGTGVTIASKYNSTIQHDQDLCLGSHRSTQFDLKLREIRYTIVGYKLET